MSDHTLFVIAMIGLGCCALGLLWLPLTGGRPRTRWGRAIHWCFYLGGFLVFAAATFWHVAKGGSGCHR